MWFTPKAQRICKGILRWTFLVLLAAVAVLVLVILTRGISFPASRSSRVERDIQGPESFLDADGRFYFPSAPFGIGEDDFKRQSGTREYGGNFAKVLGSTYDFGYGYANDDLVCSVSMVASIDILGRHHMYFHQNQADVMRYDKAMDYFYGLVDTFTETYGEPAYRHDDMDLRNVSEEDIPEDYRSWRHEVTVQWVRDGSLLELCGMVFAGENELGKPVLEVAVRIEVGQDVGDMVVGIVDEDGRYGVSNKNLLYAP